MSTSLLYHAFQIRGYRYAKTEYRDGGVTFHVHIPDDAIRCPQCQSRNVIRRGVRVRRFRSLPIGSRRTEIAFRSHRVACRDCGDIRWLKPDFAKDRSRHTRAFYRYVLELLRHMNIKDVAAHLGVSWTFVKNIQKDYLQKHYGRPCLKAVRTLAIDEICIGKGHRYLTIVLNPETGEVLFVGDGKGADALVPFWKRLARAGAVIEAVAIDMSAAYIKAVSENLPEAAIVFDHFHIIKLMNEKLTKLRRQLFNEANGPLAKKVLKGTRWLLLKNPDNLNSEKNERERLAEALKINESLALAYYMKEDMRQIWSQPDKATATRILQDWTRRALASDVRVLQEMGRTISGHAYGILAWYDHPLTTAALEGTNTKVKLMQRAAYGHRDPEFFKLKIYACKEIKYRLVG